MIKDKFTMALENTVHDLIRNETRGFKSAITALRRKIDVLEGKDIPTGNWSDNDETVFKQNLFYLIEDKAKKLGASSAHVRKQLKVFL